MEYRKIVLALVFACALFPLSADDRSAAVSGIITNAADGVYATDQRLWFSVGSGDRLRVVLDEKEVYRGLGPASSFLTAKTGAEQDYRLVVERRSPPPEDALRETKTFSVRIDRKPPAAPDIKARELPGGLWTLTADNREDASRIKLALETSDGRIREIADFGSPFELPSGPLSLLAWSVDRAGNSSDAVPFHFEPLSLDILSPIPGTWANEQRLAVSSSGHRDVRWTDDGSDPLGPGGRPYTGEALVGKSGDVLLRVACVSPDGRTVEKSLAYSVVPPGKIAQADAQDLLSRLAELQGYPLRSPASLSIPQGYAWAVDDALPSSDAALVLRPASSLRRRISLFLSQPDSSVRFRYTYILDGVPPADGSPSAEGQPDPSTAAAVAGAESGAASIRIKSSSDPVENETLPTIVSVGSMRAASWSRKVGTIRYRLDSSSTWFESYEPILLPQQGGNLEWVADRGGTVAGPYSIVFDPLPVRATQTNPQDAVRFSYASRSALPANEWRYISGSLYLAPHERASFPFPDACDGEDLYWRMLSPDGSILRAWRVDRRVPKAPSISAPEEGAWLARSVRIEAASQESDPEHRVHIITDRLFPSGKTLTNQSLDSFTIGFMEDSPVHVSVLAYIVDTAGNKSPEVRRSFTVDSHTIYVSDGVAAVSVPVIRDADRDGSRDKPYRTMDEAIRAVRTDGRTSIKIGGGTELRASTNIPRNVTVKGFYASDWSVSGTMSGITVFPDAGFTVNDGFLAMEGVAVRRTTGSSPLMRVGLKGRVELDDCVVSSNATLISISGGGAALRDTLLAAKDALGNTIVGVSAANASLILEKSRIQVDANQSIAVEALNSTVQVDHGSLSVQSIKTGVAMVLRSSKVSLASLSIDLSALDFASALEISGGSLAWSQGTVYLKARDVVGVAIDDAPAVLTGIRFEIASDFVARGFSVKTLFPEVKYCTFAYTGSSAVSELFSVRDAAPALSASTFSALEPKPGSIGGNSVKGFSHLLGAAYPIGKINLFNRLYAPSDSANTLVSEP